LQISPLLKEAMHIFSSKIEVPTGCCLGGYGDSDASIAKRAGSLNVAGFGFCQITTGALIEVCSVDALYAGDLVKQSANQSVQRIFAASHTHFAPMLDASKPSLVPWFINSVTYSCSHGFGGRLRQFDLVEHNIQIVSSEFPFKRFGDLFVIELEPKDPFFERFQRFEVIG